MRFEEYLSSLQNKTVAVIGIGVSNRPLVELLLSRGVAVTACDKKDRAALGPLAEPMDRVRRTYWYGIFAGEPSTSKLFLPRSFLSGVPMRRVYTGILPILPEVGQSTKEDGSRFILPFIFHRSTWTSF